MENASKALLMAGGMLIALLVIGALVLMFNQIGDYEKGNQGIKKTSEIAEFNIDFERYLDDKGITGADVISLVNKVNDYNNKAKKGGINNSIDYNIKMSITISGIKELLGPKEKYVFSANSMDNLNVLLNSSESKGSEFKGATFIPSKAPDYQNGQIQNLYLKLKK